MATIFLSYDREDAAKARSIAVALEKAGHSVWWDRHIKGGAQYSKEIEQALKAADAVVVLWSERSVDSAWVRDEAAAGRDSGRLVPVLIDATEAPLGFRQYQAIDLSRWKARGKALGLASLLESVASVGAQVAPLETTKSVGPGPSRAWPLRMVGALVAVAMLIGVAAFLMLRDGGGSAVQTIIVAPANKTPEARALARDLLVSLGHLQSARSDALRLVEQSDHSTDKADLIFEASAASALGATAANLVLLAGKDRSLLWSRDFKQELGSPADLKQQIAFTAARILGCATEGLSAEGKGLNAATLKLYLNACAQFAEIERDDTTSVVSGLMEVTKRAPNFAAAWAKLLIAESNAAKSDVTGRIEKQDAAILRGRIAAARRIDPALPEAAMVEALLLPPREFGKRLALIDRAIRDAPDNVQLLSARSGALRSVGRLRASIRDASHAAALDPLSPTMRDAYISVLLYSGQTDVAIRELHKAEQLWPGTESVEQMQYRYHSRFGDPRVARRLLQGEAQGYSDLFLTARANPSPANVERLIAYMWSRVRSGEAGPADASGLTLMMQALGQFGRTDELFRLVSSWESDQDLSVVSDIYFRPMLRGFIRDPRFLRVAQRAGLLDYWRTSGNWPDFCFEPDQPYDCKTEAAKLS